MWDYPRPPCLERDDRHVRVCAGDIEIASTRRAIRVLETASPPTFYLPPEDVDGSLLQPAACGGSFCEWKGRAAYWDVLADAMIDRCAWSYPEPQSPFEPIAGYFSFYPGRLECYVNDERVRAQPGGFYGGWITDEIVGPFKGDPGTASW